MTVYCVLYLSSRPVNRMWPNAHICIYTLTHRTHFEDTKKKAYKTNPAVTVNKREGEEENKKQWSISKECAEPQPRP